MPSPWRFVPLLAAVHFGIVLDKDSSLIRCVSSALDAPRDDGTLASLQNTWLADAGKAPVIR